jgi:hypothetical protein
MVHGRGAPAVSIGFEILLLKTTHRGLYTPRLFGQHTSLFLGEMAVFSLCRHAT